jgi:alpha-1,3/alpha-1,6-mannosyltransferase
VYTPENEHFGIVPLEAMARGRPVIACASGGPLETVSHMETGLLSEPTALGFANAIVRLLTMTAPAAEKLRAAARQRMQEHFARPAFSAAWLQVLSSCQGANGAHVAGQFSKAE